jgi:hypothetical protein
MKVAISSGAEIELKEEKVYAHIDDEKECDAGTWFLDTGATNHMSGCQATFTKLNTVVLDTVHFGDDSMAWIKGHRSVVFVCNSVESQSLKGVYFIIRLATNIVSITQLDEVGYNIDINTAVMKIREPGSLLVVRVKREVNRLYLLHIKLVQLVCFAVRGQDNEVAWHWHECFWHINMAAIQKLAWEELVHNLPEIGQVKQLCEAC